MLQWTIINWNDTLLQNNPFCEPSVINTEVNGVKSYATSDLFDEHPKKPGYWRVYGRTDDQIMHNTGEKVRFSISSIYD